MKLSELLNLHKGHIVSIVGAGGKTSLMFSLAEELRYNHKVLVTTTTKIYVPNRLQYDFMYMWSTNNKNYISNSCKGIYVYGNYINLENKIIGVNFSYLKNMYEYFDYILIEADGSKRKPIKGWNDDEPIVYNQTDKTIGVLDITIIGKKVTEYNIHRLDKFIEITNASVGDLITIDHILSLITHPKGLFKNSFGEKILFINKVENTKEKLLAANLIDIINNTCGFSLDKIIIGSLKNKRYE